jgi:glycosyltransferase involved in cell wall biosynthesis
MDQPAVSVLMPVYNAASYLDEAVSSVLAQTFTDFELVAIDDDSTDDSLAILRRYELADSRVRVFSRPNQGITLTRRELVERSSAPLIAMLDADDVAHADRLALQVGYMRDNPDVVLVGSRYSYIDTDGRPVGAPIVPVSDGGADAWHMSGRGCSIHQSTVIFSREAYQMVGGYSTAYPYMEDFELWLRMAEIGPLAVLDRELVQYRIHPTSSVRRDPGSYDRYMWLGLREAVVRRGYHLDRVPFDDLGTDEQVNWINLAVSVGEHSAARRWAARRFRRSPGWRTFKQFVKTIVSGLPGALAVYERIRYRTRPVATSTTLPNS